MTKKIYLASILLAVASFVFAQKKEGFTILHEAKTTSVKNQNNTGTCWCFATTSFIETEMLRNGKPEIDLSEMFTVRNVYIEKARMYFLAQGKNNFSQGGQAHDVINSWRKNGLMPNEAYTGLCNGSTTHSHGKLEEKMNKIMDYSKNNETTIWKDSLPQILDRFMGKVPASFIWNNKTYTPKTFAAEVVGLNPDDYIEITSFTHKPYYKNYAIEVQDNWSHDLYMNLPLDELIQTMDSALFKGFSVDWDGDVSEDEFQHYDGLAWYPAEGTSKPRKEINISPEMRQEAFETLKTTDDHLMHITGIAKDANGIKYYLTKNSWGAESNQFGGYLYLSEAFVRLKTIAILLHKNAIPKEIASKIRSK